MWVVLTLAAWSAAAVFFFFSRGWLLYYGDAEAHLNIARRMFDSQTPGYDQIGTAWLPLPHWLMLPFVRSDEWWRSGIAGSISAAACFVAAGAFLFAAVRRAFASAAAAVAARECEPFTDGVATEWYRRRMVSLLVGRALAQLAPGAGGGGR